MNKNAEVRQDVYCRDMLLGQRSQPEWIVRLGAPYLYTFAAPACTPYVAFTCGREVHLTRVTSSYFHNAVSRYMKTHEAFIYA